MKIINQQKWNRKEHFEFFSKYDEPFFGLVAEVDCTQAYQTSKENNASFFGHYLHKSLLAANQVKAFRYRIHEEGVAEYETIHASPTIGRDDGTYGLAFIPFALDFQTFCDHLSLQNRGIRNSKGLAMNKDTSRQDVIHFSSIPWIRFTGLSHPRDYKSGDSVPKITFGKTYHHGEIMMLPVAVHVHHGLADGLHVARFLENLQELLNQPLHHG